MKEGSSLTAQTTIATWIAKLYTFSGDSMCSAKSVKPSTVSHCMQGRYILLESSSCFVEYSYMCTKMAGWELECMEH